MLGRLASLPATLLLDPSWSSNHRVVRKSCAVITPVISMLLSFQIQQVMREKPVMVNLMRDIPRSDTQPEAHCRLLVCLFVPFFELDDLKAEDETWPDAKERVEHADLWDARTKPFRLNIAGMLRQRKAADEERKNRENDNPTFTSQGQALSDGEDEVILSAFDDGGIHDLEGISVIPVTRGRLLTKIFVDDAVDAFVSAGFKGNDTVKNPSETSRPRTSPNDLNTDWTRITTSAGTSGPSIVATQKAVLDAMSDKRVASLAEVPPPPSEATSSTILCDAAVLDPYIMQLRNASSVDMPPSQIEANEARRIRNNDEVARSPIGALTASQHPVAQRLAQEFGLNPKQCLAFYIYAKGMFAKHRDPNADALRLYIGGGAGAGKSHLLKCMKAFIECPALRGQIPDGRMLAIAFQGKQAAAVGGQTAHSVCQAGSKDGDGSLSGSHDDQRALTDKQAAPWKRAVTLAVEEVSMIGCELLISINKAACEVFPSHKDKPFGNLVVVFCGDFNQLK